MKVAVRQIVFEAEEWQPEMKGGAPKWGPAAHGIHQASDGQGVIGIVGIKGQVVHVHPGDYLIKAEDGSLLEVLRPPDFAAKFRTGPASATEVPEPATKVAE